MSNFTSYFLILNQKRDTKVLLLLNQIVRKLFAYCLLQKFEIERVKKILVTQIILKVI